jgi:hypothetical protein
MEGIRKRCALRATDYWHGTIIGLYVDGYESEDVRCSGMYLAGSLTRLCGRSR